MEATPQRFSLYTALPSYLRGKGPPLAPSDPAPSPLFAHGAFVVSIGPAVAAGIAAPPRAAHGAPVIGIPVIGIPVGPPAAMGSRRPWGAPVRAAAHGAAVMGIPAGPPAASGSRGAGCREVGADGEVMLVDLGWLEVWTLAWICFAAGSFSHAKREPKGKCWTTGNLERTSTLYILIIPWRVLVFVSVVGAGVG